MRVNVKRDDGVTLAELLVATSIGLIVMLGVLTVVQATSRSSARTTARVATDQVARPVLNRILDELHSTCITADLAPVLPNSTSYAMSFYYATDDAADGSISVTPTPSRRMISVDQSTKTMSETVTPLSGGTTPATWAFNSPSTTKTLLTNVFDASIDGANNVPPFRYYAYGSDGVVSSTPLSTPLSAAAAASVVKVTVSFKAAPPQTTVNPDTNSYLTLSDSALLRFSPGSTVAAENTPCG